MWDRFRVVPGLFHPFVHAAYGTRLVCLEKVYLLPVLVVLSKETNLEHHRFRSNGPCRARRHDCPFSSSALGLEAMLLLPVVRHFNPSE